MAAVPGAAATFGRDANTDTYRLIILRSFLLLSNFKKIPGYGRPSSPDPGTHSQGEKVKPPKLRRLWTYQLIVIGTTASCACGVLLAKLPSKTRTFSSSILAPVL